MHTVIPGRLKHLLLCVGAQLFLAVPSQAQADAQPHNAGLSINGFGILGLVHSSEGGADYTFDNLQPAGAGRSRDWSPDVDSRLGVQATYDVNERIAAVLQVVTEYTSAGNYSPYVNWANVSYRFSPEFSLRAGRIALASFLASDSRRVGYSNVMARPPIEVYRLLALKESDGVDATWRTRLGETSNSLSLLYGSKTVVNTSGTHVHSRAVQGIFDTFEWGDLTLHLAYQERHVDNQNPPRGIFSSGGISYDTGRWFVAAEWVRALNYNARSLKITREAWYLNAGVHISAFTPYLTLSELCPTSTTKVAPVGQSTISGGLRWDFARHWDLKLQWDHLKLGKNSYGTLQNVVPGTPPGAGVNLLSMTADFVF